MENKEYPDIVPLLKHLCIALQPFVISRHIKLSFSTTERKIKINYPISDLLCGFSKLLCSIIDYMPPNNKLHVQAEVIVKDNSEYVSIKVHNTGINLTKIPALTNNSSIPVTMFSSSTNETTFEVCCCLSLQEVYNAVKYEAVNGSSVNFPVFFIEFRKRLQSHFTKSNNPVARLNETNPKGAVFVTNINNCIFENMENERFDANALSRAVAISRAQLFRKLKSLTGISPGSYIKTLRLQKAKELLETSDVSVSEAAYKTGFRSPSHFTKVFAEKYGICPSMCLRPKRMQQMNK